MNWKSLFGTALAVFAVWFALGVPATAFADETFDGCTFYSRLKVSGNLTSCAPIDTGFIPCGTTSIDAKYREHAVSANSCLFCSRNSSTEASGVHFTYFTHVSGKGRWDYNGKQNWPTAHSASQNPNYRLIIENGKATVYTTLDRAPLSTMTGTASTFAGQYRMYLFASYDTGYTGYNNGGQYYFYYLKAYDGPIADGKLLHHYVPCKTSEGKVGVADLVEEKVLLPLQSANLLAVDDNDSLGGKRPMLDASAFSAFATFTASGYEGTEELEEFPVLVRLAEDSPTGFTYDSCAADGSDIRFADAEGQLIAHEIDTWDPAGESLIWVNVPKLTFETQFRMYIGGDGSAPTLPSSSVWRRAGYHLVYHNNIAGTTAGSDSAGSGLAGSAHNGGLVVTALDGAPMGMVDNQTNNNGWNLANNAKWSAHGGQVTMSLWSYRTDTSDNTNRGWMGVEGSYNLLNYPKDGKCLLRYGTTEVVNKVMPVAVGNWMHIAGVLNGTDAKAYQNGVLLGTGTTTAIADVSKALGVGSPNVCPGSASRNKGYLDEYRLRWGASSADWVKAEYDTVMKADFLEGVMGGAEPPVPEDWEYSFAITLSDGMKTALGSGEESDFPVLVRLSEADISGFRYGNFLEADYSDLIFVDEDGKFLDYEVDTWDASGVSLVWVRIPSLTASTTFTCRYGGPKYGHNATKTWKKFVTVIHGGACGIVDSSGSGLEVRAESTVVTASGAIIGGGIDKATQKAVGVNIKNPYVAGKFTNNRQYSVMSWTKPTAKKNMCHYGGVAAWSNAGFLGVFEKGEYLSVAVSGTHQYASGKGAIVAGEWQHTAFSYDTAAGVLDIFCDGESALHKTDAKTYTDAGPAYWTFGSYANAATDDSFQGEMDELRIYDGLVSAAWIAADYYQMMNAGAFVYAEVEEPDPEMPKLANVTLSVDEFGNIVVSGDVLRHAGEVTITLLAEGQPPVEIVLGEVEAGGSFSRVCDEDDGLVKFQNYTASVSAANGTKIAVRQIVIPVKYGKASLVDMSYRIDVTVPDGFTTVPLENFPLLVRLSTEIPGFDYAQFQNAGKDIMVFDEEGNRIPCELENWDPDGVSRLWVQVPVVTNGAKVIIGYGLSGTVDAFPGMWSEYATVLHMNDDVPGGSEVKDSTDNAVPVLNNKAASDDGVLGGGFTMGTVTGTSGACVTVPVSAKLDECEGVFTASAWTKLNASSGWGYLMSRKDKDSFASWGLQFRGAGNTGNADGLALYTAGASDSQQSLFKTLTCFKTGDWVKWSAVYNGTELSLYLNGVKFATQTTAYGAAVNGTLPLGVGGFPTAVNHGTLPAVFDEARVKVGAVGDDWVAAEYVQETGTLPLIYSEVGPTDPDSPVLSVPAIAANDDGTFHVSVTITENLPQEGSVKLVYDGVTTPMSTDDVAVPATYELTITPTAEDVTSVVTIRAKSQLGSIRSVISPGFYNGGLKIEKILDASEKGLSNGIWRVSRADSAHDLAISLVKLDSSTAEVGVDYVEFPLNAVIPDGTNSVDITVTPLMNLAKDFDTWIDLAITDGAYFIDEIDFAKQLLIRNYEIPAGGNIWCATAPGKASVGSNWTSGTAPDEFGVAVFDGDVSQADCEWDLDAAHKVKSWMQSANYHGTVTLATTFDESFPKFTVSEDMLVLGGVIKHKPHDSSHKVDFYRLSLDIGGMLVVGANAKISARALGSYGLRSEGRAVYGGSYDGARAWGSLTEPTAVGASGFDNNSYVAFGGGAIWIEVAGIVSVDGTVDANGIVEYDVYANRPSGSGGSVYIKCAQLKGSASGRITALSEAGPLSDAKALSASGGRISILQTAGEMDFPVAGLNARSAYPQYDHHAGAGTILVRSPANPNGILYLIDADDKYTNSYSRRPNSFNGMLTDIPDGQNWTLDGLVFGGKAVLRIPYGTSLNLVNGLESVSSLASDFNCGIVVDDGSLVLPSRAQAMSGNWTLTSRNEVNVTSIPGSLIVKSGANIGSIQLRADRIDQTDTLPLYGKSLLRIEGDLTVESDATLSARKCGLKKYNNSLNSGHKGVLQGHTHGGRVFNYKAKDAQLRMYTAYDSVFAPSLPGNAVPWPNGQNAEESGGVITLDIAGHFQLEGKADVSGYLDTYTAGANCSGGTGGAIDITAGSIAGRGSIKAEGGVKQAICGPGGRIAIKLRDEGADFTAFKGVISASGRVNGSDYANASSAGTVFMKTGDDRENGGTIRIAMSAGNWNINNPSSTEILSLGFGGNTADEYKELGLEITDFGFGAVNANLDMSWAKFVGRNSRLDLEGHTLNVYRAWINGNKVPVGTYHAGDEPFEDLLVDSVGSGSLRVMGYGLWVFIQ